MTTTTYSNTDELSPVLTAESGKLIALLDTCLVNGYGSKVAAGWERTLYDAATHKAVYRQPLGSNRFYLHVDDSNAAFARVFMSEDCTAFDNITNKFPDDAQEDGGAYIYKNFHNNTDTNPLPYKLVFSDKYGAFYLWIDTYSHVDDNIAFAYIGDFKSFKTTDSFNTACFAQKISSGNNNYKHFSYMPSSITSPVGGSYIARNNSSTIGSKSVSTFSRIANSNQSGIVGSKGISYPDPVSGGLLYTPIFIAEYTNGDLLIRGEIPGILAPMHNKPLSNFDTFQTQNGNNYLSLNARASSNVGQVFICTSEWD